MTPFERLKPLFFAEFVKHRAAMRESLQALAQGQPHAEALRDLARTIHTVAGNASMMGFVKLTSVARAVERAAERLRARPQRPHEAELQLLSDAVGALDRLQQAIPEENTPADAEAPWIVAGLEKVGTSATESEP